MRGKNLVAVGIAAALISGCAKKAEGQVAAIVNGEEITIPEVNAEVASQPVPPGMSQEQARQAALKRVIDRRLLANAAKEEGLNKTPEFLLRQRALNDALLVQSLARKIESTVKVPDTKAIDTFIAEHPAAFANRSILTIDQLQFTPSSDPTFLKRLEAEHSLDGIASVLREQNIAFARSTTDVDSGRLDNAMVKQIMALPAGEPFLLPRGTIYVAGVVTKTRPVPIEADKARPVAVDLIRNQEVAKAVQARADAAQKSAKIEYQKGFAPPTDAAVKPVAAN